MPAVYTVVERHRVVIKVQRHNLHRRSVQQRLLCESVLHQQQLLLQWCEQPLKLMPAMYAVDKFHRVDKQIQRNNLYWWSMQRRFVSESVLHWRELLLERLIQFRKRMPNMPAQYELYLLDDGKLHIRVQGWQVLYRQFQPSSKQCDRWHMRHKLHKLHVSKQWGIPVSRAVQWLGHQY